MTSILVPAAAFAVTIGVLVAFHEFGHFWVARRLGVRVLRYSIGFGKPILRHVSKKSGVEYVLAILPLGGYVKMLDETEGEVAEHERHLAFNRQPVWKRFLIVAAGPGFNFLLAIVVYWLVFILGVSGLKPVVGALTPGSVAAQSGLQRGDRILDINSEKVPTWNRARTRLLETAINGDKAHLQVRDQNGSTRRLTLDLSHVGVDPKVFFSKLGLVPYHHPVNTRIVKTLPGSPARQAGLEPGDVLVRAGEHQFGAPGKVVQWSKAHPGKRVQMTIRRDGELKTIALKLGRSKEGKGHMGARIEATGDPWKGMRTTLQYGPGEALVQGAGKTWDMSVLTVQMLARMVAGTVSWHNISGPIQIARYAGDTARIGLSAFLGFLAIVSLSLGVLNLLPVPVLDGGHLMYYVVEFFKGSPVSERAQSVGQQIGLTLLVMLMGLAFYNDIARLLVS